jgi:hypothetical protein
LTECGVPVAIGIATAQDVERVAREYRHRTPPQPSFPHSAGGQPIPKSALPTPFGPPSLPELQRSPFVWSPMLDLLPEPQMACEPLSVRRAGGHLLRPTLTPYCRTSRSRSSCRLALQPHARRLSGSSILALASRRPTSASAHSSGQCTACPTRR